MRPAAALLLFALATGCSDKGSDGPVAVSVIGAAPALADADRRPLPPASAMLMAATAQGLVRFDGAGQIEPGVAIRWAVSDDGLYYTFRIDADGTIGAEEAARRLRRAIQPGSRNALKPVLGAIDEIVAVTPEVIEVRLHAPRPNLLQLFAQPELGILRGTGGAGPFRVASRSDGAMLLDPVGLDAADLDEAARQRRQVRLRAERAALAIARFQVRDTAAVLGGSFVDLPLVRSAASPERMLRFDPVQGLFGLAFGNADGFLGSVENRRALAMAIDRDRLGGLFGATDWRPAITLLPAGIADLATPARPDWSDTPLPERRAIAADAVARWTAANGGAPLLRIALPTGPGSNLLFGAIRQDWAAVGVRAERVAESAAADLRLIDAVAPSDVSSWYLRRFACESSRICSGQADVALIAARDATTLAERTARLAEADARLAEISVFIPLAMPLRWSLVARRLDGFQTNVRGVHPLDHLRSE